MSSVAELQSGKDHSGENFPVASFLIAPRNRAPVMAFYRFVRAADDVSDNPKAPPEEKLRLLELMRQSLTGESNAVPEGVALRTIMTERGLSPAHALDLLEAFRRDCTKLRYRDWDDLIDYCRYSAMPVGRFVLDVHGEDTRLWPANDALCAGLQVHVEDLAFYEHQVFQPWRLFALALKALRRLRPDYDLWADFPYEYEVGKLAIDVINGSELLRRWVDDPAAGPGDLDALAARDEAAWRSARAALLLY